MARKAKPKSIYLIPYLEMNTEKMKRGEPPITPNTFLTNTLRGNSKNYNGRYHDALRKAILAESNALAVTSARGSTAYAYDCQEVREYEANRKAAEAAKIEQARLDLELAALIEHYGSAEAFALAMVRQAKRDEIFKHYIEQPANLDFQMGGHDES